MVKISLNEGLRYSLIVAFIAGCAPSENLQKSTLSADPVVIEDTFDNVAFQDAERLLQRALKADSKSPSRQQLLLDSALAFLQQAQTNRSQEILNQIDSTLLTDADYADYVLLYAEILRDNAAWQVLQDWLETTRLAQISTQLTLGQQYRWIDIETDLNIQVGAIEKSLLPSVTLAAKLPTAQKGRLHNQIWDLLSRLPSHRVASLQTETDQPHLIGWLQLAELLRPMRGDQNTQTRLFFDWRNEKKEHPVATLPPDALRAEYAAELPVTSIALLLPLQDDYRAASQTLLDGFMVAYYKFLETAAEKPHLKIYDTGKRPLQDVYSDAVTEGAKMIIGPVRSNSVHSLVGLDNLPVPTLSLNRIDVPELTGPVNLVQFGLSPLDEIDQIMERAWRLKQRRVLVIAPEQGWGRRSSDYFRQQWEKRGGRIVGIVHYQKNVKDFSPLLKAPLHIDASEARGVQLRRFVNSRLKTSARRREDVDLVLLLGYPEVARRIKPSLEYLYAADLPVYATSHIYSGSPQVSKDRDLAGIEFCAMPWSLQGHLATPLTPEPRLHAALTRFFALGHDAFLVYRALNHLQQGHASPPVFGATGLLSLDKGQITRRTQWAKFEGGRVVPLDVE